MNWYGERRQDWLKKRKRPFTLGDLMVCFCISRRTASRDVAEFLSRNPGAFVYNRRAKQYERKGG